MGTRVTLRNQANLLRFRGGTPNRRRSHSRRSDHAKIISVGCSPSHIRHLSSPPSLAGKTKQRQLTSEGGRYIIHASYRVVHVHAQALHVVSWGDEWWFCASALHMAARCSASPPIAQEIRVADGIPFNGCTREVGIRQTSVGSP